LALEKVCNYLIGQERCVAIRAWRGSGALAESQEPEDNAFYSARNHAGHSRNGNTTSSEIDATAIHLIPKPFGIHWVFANQQLPETAGELVTEGGVDNRLGHLRAGVHFAGAFKP